MHIGESYVKTEWTLIDAMGVMSAGEIRCFLALTRFGVRDNGEINISQSGYVQSAADIALYLGTTKKCVEQYVNRLKKKGLIETSRTIRHGNVSYAIYRLGRDLHRAYSNKVAFRPETERMLLDNPEQTLGFTERYPTSADDAEAHLQSVKCDADATNLQSVKSESAHLQSVRCEIEDAHLQSVRYTTYNLLGTPPNKTSDTKRTTEELTEEKIESVSSKTDAPVRKKEKKFAKLPYPESAEEVASFMEISGIVPIVGDSNTVADAFFDLNEGNGWKAGGKPVKYWPNALVGFIERCDGPRDDLRETLADGDLVAAAYDKAHSSPDDCLPEGVYGDTRSFALVGETVPAEAYEGFGDQKDPVWEDLIQDGAHIVDDFEDPEAVKDSKPEPRTKRRRKEEWRNYPVALEEPSDVERDWRGMVVLRESDVTREDYETCLRKVVDTGMNSLTPYETEVYRHGRRWQSDMLKEYPDLLATLIGGDTGDVHASSGYARAAR